MKVKRCNYIPEGEIKIIEDMDTLIHNLVTPELKELQEENKQLKEQINEYQKAVDETTSEKIDLQEENKQLKEEIEEYKRIEQEDLKAFNNYDSILTELEEWLKEQGNNGIDEWGNHYTVCLYKLNKLKEKYK